MNLLYKNPFAIRKDYMPLGIFKDDFYTYDLYALTQGAVPGLIDFGARYSDTPAHYLSGAADHRDFKHYEFFGPLPVMVAAARYFSAMFDQAEYEKEQCDIYRLLFENSTLTADQVEWLQKHTKKAKKTT